MKCRICIHSKCSRKHLANRRLASVCLFVFQYETQRSQTLAAQKSFKAIPYYKFQSKQKRVHRANRAHGCFEHIFHSIFSSLASYEYQTMLFHHNTTALELQIDIRTNYRHFFRMKCHDQMTDKLSNHSSSSTRFNNLFQP